MSANTYWAPQAKGTSLPCLSSFLDVLADATDRDATSELLLSHGDVPILRAIAAADKSTRDTVNQLMDAIERHDTITVWREY